MGSRFLYCEVCFLGGIFTLDVFVNFALCAEVWNSVNSLVVVLRCAQTFTRRFGAEKLENAEIF